MARATFRWLDHRCTLEADRARVEATARLLQGFAPELHANEGPAPEVVARPDDDVDTLEAEIVRTLLSQDSAHLHMHAAAAEVAPGRALLIVGRSGAGKSTLTTAFMAAGHRIFGDDVVPLGPDGVVAFPRMVKLEPESRLLDPGISGLWATEPATVVGVVVAEWREGARTSLTTLDSATTLRHLLDAVHTTTHAPETRVGSLAALATDARAARLRYSEAGDALPQLATWLDGGTIIDPRERRSDS